MRGLDKGCEVREKLGVLYNYSKFIIAYRQPNRG